MSILEGFPLISQTTKISADGSSPNANMDCVPTSILAGIMYLKGITALSTEWNPDRLLDMAYPEGYTGGTSAQAFIQACATLGIHLYPIDGDPGQLVQHIHEQLALNHPVVVTVPDIYVPASYGWTHVLCMFADSPGFLTALDPWPGKPTTKSDAEWTSLLQDNQIWILERSSMTPEGWKDDGTTLTAPNGISVVRGFRDYVLANNWNKDNWPLEAEQGMSRLEASNASLGGGTRQTFEWTMLEWTAERGVFVAYVGKELLYTRQQYSAIYAAYQQLKAEQALQKPPAQPPAPDPMVQKLTDRLTAAGLQAHQLTQQSQQLTQQSQTLENLISTPIS